MEQSTHTTPDTSLAPAGAGTGTGAGAASTGATAVGGGGADPVMSLVTHAVSRTSLGESGFSAVSAALTGPAATLSAPSATGIVAGTPKATPKATPRKSRPPVLALVSPRPEGGEGGQLRDAHGAVDYTSGSAAARRSPHLKGEPHILRFSPRLESKAQVLGNSNGSGDDGDGSGDGEATAAAAATSGEEAEQDEQYGRQQSAISQGRQSIPDMGAHVPPATPSAVNPLATGNTPSLTGDDAPSKRVPRLSSEGRRIVSAAIGQVQKPHMQDVAGIVKQLHTQGLLSGDEWEVKQDRASLCTCKGLHQRIVWVASHAYFEAFIIITIVINCGFLCAWDPLDTDPGSTRNRVLDAGDLVFQIIYTIEMLIKCIAFGVFCGPKAYVRSGWNLVDGTVVILGWVTYLPIGSDSSFGSIRVVRILRPLKTVQSVPGLKLLIDGMLGSVSQLCNVFGLGLFVFMLFGIAGIQLFGGKLDQKCVIPDTQLVPESESLRLCTQNPSLQRQCPVFNNTQLQCVNTGDNPNGGVTHFDNIGVAFLTLFQCITLEGWVDVMYWVDDTTGASSILYFVLLVVLGSIFLLNLIVAVIVTMLSVEHDLEDKREERDALKEQQKEQLTMLVANAQRRASANLDDGSDAADAITMAAKRRLNKDTKPEAARTDTSPPRQATGEPTSEAHGSGAGAGSGAATLAQAELEQLSPSRRRRLEHMHHPHSALPDATLPTPRFDKPSLSSSSPPNKEATGHVDFISDEHKDRDLELGEESKSRADAATTPRRSRGSDAKYGAPEEGEVEVRQRRRCRCGNGLLCQRSSSIVEARWFQMLILALILLNTVLLAVEHYDMKEWLENLLQIANFILTIIFAIEMLLKHLAFGCCRYWSQAFDAFDGIIVIISIVELLFFSEGGGVSALRALRLLRVLKLARSWKSLNELLVAIGTSVAKVAPFSIIMLLFMFIYSLLGMQLFGGKLGSPPPRTNFDSLGWALLTTFQILTGENWNEVMYICVHNVGWGAVLYFVTEVVIGAWVVLNLFLGILIDHFTELSEDVERAQAEAEEEEARVAEEREHIAATGAESGTVASKRAMEAFTKPAPKRPSAASLERRAVHDKVATAATAAGAGAGAAAGAGAGAGAGAAVDANGGVGADAADDATGRRSSLHYQVPMLALAANDTNGAPSPTERRKSTAAASSSNSLHASQRSQLDRRSSSSSSLGRGRKRTASGTLSEDVAAALEMARVDPMAPFRALGRAAATQNASVTQEERELEARTGNTMLTRGRRTGGPRATPREPGSAMPLAGGLGGRGSIDGRDGTGSMVLGALNGSRGGHQPLGSSAVPASLNLSRELDKDDVAEPSKTFRTVSHGDLSTARSAASTGQGACCFCRRFPVHPSYDYKACYCLRSRHRSMLGELVLHPAFDAVIIVMIILSCIMLAMDSYSASQGLRDVLWSMNVVLTILFTIEMLLKLAAFGVFGHPGSYCRDPWLLLDGFIVILSVLDLALGGSLRFVKALRFLRALRPLRAVKRLKGLRVVINAVVKAFPNAMHVALVSLLFFFVYGILGVNFFAGRFRSCSDPERLCMPGVAADCPARLACNGTWTPPGSEVEVAREWVNPSYSEGAGTYSFDNSIVALFTLLEVASLELWHEVMYRALDISELGWAPVRDDNPLGALFFVAFVVLGSMFILNLFVSVVVDNFRKLKQAESGGTGSLFMTKEQAAWVEVRQVIAKMPPAPLAAPPKSASRLRSAVFTLVTHQAFEAFIMVLIVFNVAVMATQHANQKPFWDDLGFVANIFFAIAFVIEMVLKIYGLGWCQYIASHWNKFDAFLVLVSLFSISMQLSNTTSLPIDLDLFRVLRVFRMFRLIKSVPQLRVIFSTLFISLPSMANVGTLMLLLFFMFAVVAMNLFGDRPYGQYITEHANFRSFGPAFLLMLRMSTGESWNGLMHECFDPGDVGGAIVAYAYFSLFVVLGQFMMLNLFVAVILENFEREMDVSTVAKVTKSDLELFADVWASIPRPIGPLQNDASRLPHEALTTLLERVAPPLGFHPKWDSPVYRMRFMGDLDLNLTSDGALLYTTTLEALARRAISVDENDGAGGVGSSRRFGTAHNDRKLGLIARATGSSPHMGHTSSGIFGTASAHLGGTTAVQDYRVVAYYASTVLQQRLRDLRQRQRMRRAGRRRRSSIIAGREAAARASLGSLAEQE